MPKKGKGLVLSWNKSRTKMQEYPGREGDRKKDEYSVRLVNYINPSNLFLTTAEKTYLIMVM